VDAVVTLAAALLLAVVQMLPRHLERLHREGRSHWLSVGGGVAVAFVFLELIPQLAEAREEVVDVLEVVPVVADVHHLAFAGLLVFYGVEVLVRRTHEHQRGDGTWIDQLAIGLFAVYYVLIGKLLWDQIGDGLATLAIYTAVMGLHFLVVDFGLRARHRDAYIHTGRWVLAVAVLVGWGLGGTEALPAWLEGMMLSVMAGALALVALKEELPAERRHFGWFASGVIVCAALLAAL
jgi:zinc transporter ZupT